MSAPDKSSTIAAREVTAALVRQHGVKRGLHIAGQRLGISERWARGIHYGEAQAVSAAVAIRAERARLELARQRAAQLRAELMDLERTLHGDNLEAGRSLRTVAR